MLVSESTGRRYTGQTDDLARRLAEHNDPAHSATKFTTRQPGPWRMVHHEQYATRAEAMRREKWLKSGIGRQWLDAHIDRASPPPAD